MREFLQRHAHVALSLSGGKDSLACLHLFRPHWDQLTVYWLNTGDAFPETIKFMRQVRDMVPHFKEVRGLRDEVVATGGWPSDVVPHGYSAEDQVGFGPTPFKLQSRLSCCYRSMMLPLYRAMLGDGVTCAIRGKRRDEDDKTGLESGHVTPEGMELCFPILDWTSADVRSYLASVGVPLPKFYEYGDHSIDCMHCTAFWGDGHAKYLAAEHPGAYTEYVRRIRLIKTAVANQMAACEVGD